CTDEMEKPEEPITEAALEALRAENAALAERVEALRRENQELERTRHRLQLEVDVLKKADEILKKEEGVNPDHLSNREKAVVIDALRNTYRLKELLECLKLSKSSYFYQKAVLDKPDQYQRRLFLALCKPPAWCRIEAPHRRITIWPERIAPRKKMPAERRSVSCCRWQTSAAWMISRICSRKPLPSSWRMAWKQSW